MKVKKRIETVDGKGIVIEREQPRYGYFLDDNGERCFGEVGVVDTYAEILRHKDDTDYSILKKYLFENGSNKDVGVYGVRPELLTDVNDANTLVMQLNEMYNCLPNEIKNKYKNFSEVINGFTKEDLQILETNLNNIANSSEVKKDE